MKSQLQRSARATQGGLQVRAMILRGSANAQSRSITICLSSESKVDRGDYVEVLSHNPGDVDLSRLQNSAPLLVGHNQDDVVGVLERAWLDNDRRCRCIARFGNSEKASEVWGDVQDGIRVHASVGYEHTAELGTTRDPDTGKALVRFAWLPYEVSLVSCPADLQAGVGRSFSPSSGDEGDIYYECPECEEVIAAADILPSDSHQSSKADYVGFCPRCNARLAPEDEADDDAEPRISTVEFTRALRTVQKEKYMTAQNAKISLMGLSQDDVESFSIVRAIRDILHSGAPTGLEAEVLAQGRRDMGSELQGQLFIPMDCIVGAGRSDPLFRDLSSTGMGGQFVQTTVHTPIIELLRNKMCTQKAGGQILAGLQGNVAIPKQTGSATAQVLSEQATLNKSTQVIAQVALTPHRIGAVTSFSKQLMLQSSVDVESFVRSDLMKVLAIQSDYFVLQGQGGAEPVGIRYTTGIGSVTFGATATWAKVLEFETGLSLANADVGRMAYVVGPLVKSKWKNLSKVAATNFPCFIWESPKRPDADGEVNCYASWSTNQMLNSEVCFGNFEESIFALWGGMDCIIDPYTSATEAKVNVVINAFVDHAVRHAASFAWSTDSGAQ
jgi:hypothetical protein